MDKDKLQKKCIEIATSYNMALDIIATENISREDMELQVKELAKTIEELQDIVSN